MIDKYTFGEFIINGEKYGIDVKLIGEKAENWHTPNHHLLQREDIEDLVNLSPDILIIGKGASGVMEIPQDVISFLKEKRIKFIIENTGKACEEYNKALKEKKNVAAVMHGTC